MAVRSGGVLLLASCLVACSTQHGGSGPGGAFGADRKATVETRTWKHRLAGFTVGIVSGQGWITSMDGVPVLTDKVTTRAGLHSFVVERDWKRPAHDVAACSASFRVEGGRTYRIVPETTSGSWRATVRDDAGGATLPCLPLHPVPLRRR